MRQPLNFVVAEGGLEPPTSGLSLRAGLRLPNRATPSLALFGRCPMSASLNPPPAALGLHSQRAPLVGLITRGTGIQLFLSDKTKRDAHGVSFVLVAGEGLKPTTSGL